jgi:hypothetical protein
MKRRKFIQSLALAPAAGATVIGQAPPAAPPQGPTAAVPGSPAPAADPLTYGSADEAGETVLSFFTPTQFATLKRLGRLFVPAAGGNPGADECRAAAFLDFLLSRSPEERQTLYRAGLDGVGAQATRQFGASFADATDTQADAVVMAFLGRPWRYEAADPVERFLRAVQSDLRRATVNAREWAVATRSTQTVNYLRPL